MRKARILGTALAALFVLAPVFVSAQSEEAYDKSYARLSFVNGNVSILRGQDLGTETAEVNLPVVEGDKLQTGDGQAEVQFGRRNFLRLDGSSEASFAALPKRGDDHVRIQVVSGQAYLRVTELGGEKNIEVHTPDASFYILEEGLYRFDIGTGGATEIFVFEGSAEAAGEEGSVVVGATQRLSAENGRLLSDPESFSVARDGFDRWNETRDGILGQRAETSYLPASLSEYEGELNNNGRWANESSYGNVWVPYIHDTDWRPYMYGRWVWYPIIGWTWVSSEPWGWATYHYGRWQWGINMGWYWIPRTHWGPAWVNWYNDRNYIGWSPLSYYDRPGCLIGGRYSDRWNGDNYPYNSRAMTVVRRDRMQSPAISRHALRSSELGALGRISLRAQQPDVRPVLDRTALKSPVTGRTLSGFGSRATVTGRGSVSKGTLRSPVSAGGSSRNSLGRTWPSTTRSSTSVRSLSGSTVGGVRSLRTYPSRGTGPSSYGTIRSNSNGRTGTSVIRERITGSSSRESVSRSTRPSYSSRSSSSSSLRRSPGSYSGSSSSRSYTAPRYSAPSRSYSAPSYSKRTYSPGSLSRSSGSSSGSSYSRGYSSPRYSAPSRSYSAPSYSGRSYSSGSYSGSSSSRSYSAPKSSSSSRGSVSSSSPSSSHSHSSSSSRSSSSGRSGSVRRK